MRGAAPARGEVWLANLDPTRGHEQAGVRPSVVVSSNIFNSGPTELVVVIPMTTTRRTTPLHIQVEPPEGGLRRPSFVKCEDIRSVATERLIERWGQISARNMSLIEDRLRTLLDL